MSACWQVCTKQRFVTKPLSTQYTSRDGNATLTLTSRWWPKVEGEMISSPAVTLLIHHLWRNNFDSWMNTQITIWTRVDTLTTFCHYWCISALSTAPVCRGDISEVLEQFQLFRITICEINMLIICSSYTIYWSNVSMTWRVNWTPIRIGTNNITSILYDIVEPWPSWDETRLPCDCG